MIKLIIFLGNPGKQYENTRHNIGFSLCDYKFPQLVFQKKFFSLYSNYNSIKILKPQTLMNNSGKAVQAAMSYFSIESSEILVVHDDMELDFSEMKIQQGGGLKGHNGLKSIKNFIKKDDFYRLRFGIGRPKHNNVAAYVLSKFDTDEKISLPIQLDKASKLIDSTL